jgi:hypothetical protein
MTTKQGSSAKDEALRKHLLAIAGDLIGEAKSYSDAGDEIWALACLRAAAGVLEAVQNL